MQVLGKVGKVVRFTPKKDVVVAFGAKTWVFHPACLTPAPDEEIFKINPRTTVAIQSAAGIDDILALLMAQMIIDAAGESMAGPEDFLRAVAKGNNHLTEKFLGSRPELANQVIKGKTALILASHYGHDQVASTLLKHKASTEQTGDLGHTPLLAAVVGRHVSTTIILLDAGANVNFANPKGRTAIHIASKAGEDELVKLLIDRKCDVNPQDSVGDTPLHDAIFENHNKVIDLLVCHPGLEFRKKNGKGMNVLHWAAYHDSPRAVDKILGRCKNMVDVKNENGFAALHIAAINNHIQVATHLLIKGSATVNIRSNKEQTPLHLAAEEKYYNMTKILLDYGAEVNVQDVKGMTPLHFAVGEGMSQQTVLHFIMSSSRVSHVEKIKIGCFLVNAGAKIDIRNTSGKTPIDVCQYHDVRRAIVRCAEQRKQTTPRRPSSAARESAIFRQMEMNCIECGDNTAEITYEPCKHRPHCLQCTFDFDKCPVCYRVIEVKKDNDGKVIIPAVNLCATH